jgi:regulator of sirC expression with transglutaminase-like and TPR domain
MTMQQSNKSTSTSVTESASVRFAQPQFGSESSPSASVWSALDPWKWLATTADHDIDLLDAALLVCLDEYPGLDVAQFKRRLERHRRRMLASADMSAPVFDRLRTLNHYFFGELNFSGNFLDYYDPRNSLLCDVWNRRLGIPLSLAVLYQEFAKSLDMQLEGVLFPGHFLVRLDLPEGLLVLDPFHRGKSLSAEELQLRARAALGNEDLDDVELQEVIAPASRKATVVRMLHNLKAIYAEKRDYMRAVRVADRLVRLLGAAGEVRDRGLLYQDLGAFKAAARDFELYLRAEPEALDAETIRSLLIDARRSSRALN